MGFLSPSAPRKAVATWMVTVAAGWIPHYPIFDRYIFDHYIIIIIIIIVVKNMIIIIINKNDSSNIYYIYTPLFTQSWIFWSLFLFVMGRARSPGWSKIGGCGHLPKHVVSLGISQNHSKSSGTTELELTQLTESISCAMPILMVTTYPSLFVIGLDWN